MEEEKKPYHTNLCAFRCLISGPQNQIIKIKLVENYSFLENHVTVSHNVSYYQYQQLSIACYQVRFYAKTYLGL